MANDKTIKKSYWGVIPADVRYCRKIADGAKLLYSEITALCNERGYCWASNKYFSDLYNTSPRTVSRWVSSLEKEGFIFSKTTKSTDRQIFLAQRAKFNLNNLNAPDESAEDEQSDLPSAHKTKKVSTPKKPVKKVVAKYSEQDLYLAELLLSKIIYNFPAFANKKVKISDWADEIRKLRETDKATPEQIEFMICWVQGGEVALKGKPSRKFEPHDFWAKNILSPGKLRKQWFDHLVPQLQDTFKKQIKKTSTVQL